MDKIILLLSFSIIGLISKGDAQLQCIICNDCPDANELDSNMVQYCEIPTTTTTAPPENPGTTIPAAATTGFVDIIVTQTPPIVIPTTTPQIPTAPPVLIGHKYKQVMLDLVGSHHCFVVHRRVADEIHVNRGCVVTRETEGEMCAEANLGAAPEYCRLCTYNECNNASKYFISLTVILSSLFIILINH